jgi:hypothetical protein
VVAVAARVAKALVSLRGEQEKRRVDMTDQLTENFKKSEFKCRDGTEVPDLTEARIRISNEKNKDSQDYIVVKNLGLETKIKEKIKMCEENIERYLQRGE